MEKVLSNVNVYHWSPVDNFFGIVKALLVPITYELLQFVANAKCISINIAFVFI